MSVFLQWFHFCRETISSKSWKSPVFAFWTLADEPESVVCYRWVGNLQDLPFHDWVVLKSASNCNSLVSRLCILTCNPLQWLPTVSKARSSMQVSDKSILTRCGNDAKTLISGRMNIQTKLWWGKWNSNNWLDNNKETKRTNTHIWTELPYEQLGHNISLAAELYTSKTRATQLQFVYVWYLHIHFGISYFRYLHIYLIFLVSTYLICIWYFWHLHLLQ